MFVDTLATSVRRLQVHHIASHRRNVNLLWYRQKPISVPNQSYISFICSCSACSSRTYKATVISPGIPLVFEILGDWGETLLPGQANVAVRMENWGALHHPEFIITTGDNFYPNVGIYLVEVIFNLTPSV